MRCRLTLTLLSVTLIAVAACGERDAEAEREATLRAARAQISDSASVAAAEEAYDAAVFDTVTWDNPAARTDRGGLVWRSSCEKCHGSRGEGNGDFAIEVELEVPDMTAAEWVYAGDIDGIRQRIFVGHAEAMPSWGLVGLKYRDLDAVAGFIALGIHPMEPAQE
jgi:mono/diheme cytochrome c family protein